MDDLTLMKGFRAERVKDDMAARAEIKRALEDRFEAALAPPAPVATSTRRRRHLLRRRPLVVFAGAAAAAAAIAGILVLGSGPTAQPAAAEILHETAAIAASPDAPASSQLPGPGQFLYTKVKRLQLEGWIPAADSSLSRPDAVLGSTMSRPGAFNALMPTTEESWLALDGAGRLRQVAGTPRFFTSEEKSRWAAAGSPLPPGFDPAYQQKYPPLGVHVLELRRGVMDTEHPKWKGFRFPDTSRLPTEPKALLYAVGSNQISVRGFNLLSASAKHLDTQKTIRQLFNILLEGNPMRPQLRAAVFNALAELPGIEVDTNATDFLGRQGYAIRSIDKKTGSGTEFIFDPDTAGVLAERDFITKSQYGLPASSTVSETAYLKSAIVNSRDETG